MNAISRRQFLQEAGLGLAAGAFEAQLLANPYNLPIGLQLYTVRDHLDKDLEGTLARVAEIGYREVEIGSFNFYGRKPAELRRIIASHGLKVFSMHFTEPQLQSGLARCIAQAKECGLSYLGLASLEGKSRASLESASRRSGRAAGFSITGTISITRRWMAR